MKGKENLKSNLSWRNKEEEEILNSEYCLQVLRGNLIIKKWGIKSKLSWLIVVTGLNWHLDLTWYLIKMF
jgi:hypothetical protein